MSAAFHGFAAVLTALLDAGAEVNAITTGKQSALIVAAIHGHNECIRLLVDRGADLDYKEYLGYTPLLLAIGQCDLLTLSFLIEQGADVHICADDTMTALRLAQEFGRNDVVELLNQAGARE